MTVQNQNNKHIYNGDGAAVLWPYTFSIGEDPGNPLSGNDDWIKVILVDPAGSEIPLTSDYYVDLVNHQVKYPGYEPGTEPAPELQPPKLPVGWKIVLLRDVPLTQEMDLVTQGPYLAEDVERAFDKITFIAQQLAEKLGRVLIGPVSSVINFVLPAPMANALLGWSDDGTRIENKTGIPSLFSASEVQGAIDHVTDPVAAHQSSAIQHGAGTVETAINSKLDATAQAADTAKVAGKTVDLTGIQDGQALVYNAATEEFIPGDAGAGVPGLTNYIASGLKLRHGADLNLTVETGRASISEKDVQFHTEQILALAARRAQLVYATLDGAVGKIGAAFPAADAGTVCRWIIDGSATIANTVGNNNLVRNGTVTQVDGWIGYAGKGDGISGYYVSANSTGFPTTGSKALVIVFTHNVAVAQTFVAFGTGSGSRFLIGTDNGTRLKIGDGSTWFSDTGYDLQVGEKYYIEAGHEGSVLRVSVNGRHISSWNGTWTLSAGVLYVFQSVAGSYSAATVDYVEVRNALRTPAQIAAISNVLLLPCRYYTSETANTYTDIRSILPADSIALGFARTDATHPIEANDTDYRYGRREGAVGGNRRVFLGWKYFSGSIITLEWDSPFDTRKVKAYYVWAEDASGRNESDVYLDDASGNRQFVPGNNTSAKRFRVFIGAGACLFNGSVKTSGYIGCYAEVIE